MEQFLQNKLQNSQDLSKMEKIPFEERQNILLNYLKF